jgi:hypothetical protein
MLARSTIKNKKGRVTPPFRYAFSRLSGIRHPGKTAGMA